MVYFCRFPFEPQMANDDMVEARKKLERCKTWVLNYIYTLWKENTFVNKRIILRYILTALLT